MTGAGRDATQGYLVVACAEAAAPRITARYRSVPEETANSRK
jgi:hypothetical protein